MTSGRLCLYRSSNRGWRLDLIVVYENQRYVIETKIWRDAALFDKGLDQLETYLTSERQSEGYYVVFHACPNVYGQFNQDEFEYIEQRDQTTIHIYLVRLGHIFENL